jgi:SAM-dependent methyltransferase
MKSIKEKATIKESVEIQESILNHKPLKSILSQKARSREKSPKYTDLEKLLHDDYGSKTNFNFKKLDQLLHNFNLHTGINVENSIQSNRNILYRNLVLKVRNIIQNEIRFTLDPIIQNQELFNHYSVNTINELILIFKKLDKVIPDIALINSLDQNVQSNKAAIDSLDQNVQSNKAAIESFNLELSNQKTLVIESEIKRLYNFFLNREPKSDEITIYRNSVLNNSISYDKLILSLCSSEEYLQIKYQKSIKNDSISDKFSSMLNMIDKLQSSISSQMDTLKLQTQEMSKKSQDFIEYKISCIENPESLLPLINIQSIAYYWSSPLTERFTEYLWVVKHLKKHGNLLDIGCSESIFAKSLAQNSSINVYGIDIRDYENPNFQFFREDAKETHFDHNFFDQITAISSIEHFGLPVYDNSDLDKKADQKTMTEIKRILKPNGTLLLSLPFGLSPTKWYRKYNPETLAILLNGFKIDEIKYFVQTNYGWQETDSETAANSGESKIISDLPESIVVCKAIKP